MNATKTAAFLNLIDSKTRREILAAISSHYGITENETLAEITDPESEHLLDYLTGGVRTATSLLMKRHGLA